MIVISKFVYRIGPKTTMAMTMTMTMASSSRNYKAGPFGFGAAALQA